MAISLEEKERRKEERRKKKWNVQHKVINDLDHKYCKKCDEWHPATTEFFYKKSNYDGLDTYCIKCTINDSTKWRLENPEHYREIQSTYYEEHKEWWLDINRQYKKENRDKIYDKTKEWHEKFPDKRKGYGKDRRKKDHIISRKEWKACKEYFGNSCAYCGLHINDHLRIWKGELKKIDLHKEHVDANGSIYLDNCVPACHYCNSQKWEYPFEEWYSEGNPKYSQDRYNKIIRWLSEDYKLYFQGFREKRKHKSKIIKI